MRSFILCTAAVTFSVSLGASEKQERPESAVVAPALFEGLEMRMIGPLRGGRVTAVTGVPGEPFTFYMGSTGGGVWRTRNAGESWHNVSDDFFEVGSIGAIEVAPSDPNVVYVGTGSACPRGNVSVGDGVWRSTDAGRTWRHVGLPEAGQIGRIRVDPRDPDRVFVAALGNVFGPNPERGVFRSLDGGGTWEKVLFVSEQTGAVDLAMNPRNPREIYAALWRVERKPWTLVDGGEESGLYKTTDGGDTWQRLSGRGGLPPAKGAEGEALLLGRIGVTVSPARPERVWAQVTAIGDAGGLYRSDDAGEKWTRVSGDRRLQTRGWYYSHVVADPVDPDTVYALNVEFYKSIDGGRNFEEIETLHADNHDLWIDPTDPRIMIEGNDGGAHVSLDGGEHWSTLFNQPTAEFYRVTVDQSFPYRVYGAQQDNSTISVPSRSFGGITPTQDWRDVAGGESGHIAVHPDDPDLTYAGNYIGQIERYDHRTGHGRNVILYPELADGVAPRDLRYRFQWNAPIVLSPHDPDVVYHTSNYVHRTRDGGKTWETISPDLTRNDPEKGALPGGPVQHDDTGVEVYNTVFAFAESPHEKGVLWAGTDDGRVHLSRDDGATWSEVTPSGMPEGTVNVVEVSPHRPDRVYVTVYRYRRGDFRPFVYRGDDYGARWTLLTDGRNGIPEDHPVRVVREDTARPGLLYAGTEFGLFVSFDDGAHWQTLQLDLPRTPVTDLRVHRDDLVVATQGRSFWVLDDLTALREAASLEEDVEAHLYTPRETVRVSNPGRYRGDRTPGAHPGGAVIRYYLAEPDAEAELVLEIRNAAGETLRRFSSVAEEKPKPRRKSPHDREVKPLPKKAGLNQWVWDLRTERLELAEGAVMSLGYVEGAYVPPGRYEVRLSLGETLLTRSFDVVADPRLPEIGAEDLEAQFRFVETVRARFDETHHAVRRLRSIREQVAQALARAGSAGIDVSELQPKADAIREACGEIEEALIQTRNEASQDPLNFPPKLDNQLVYLYGHVTNNYGRPGDGDRRRLADLEAEITPHLERLDALVADELAAFNVALAAAGASGVLPPKATSGGGASP